MFILIFFIKTLKTLDLSLNKIGDTGVQYLADALRHNQVTLLTTISII